MGLARAVRPTKKASATRLVFWRDPDVEPNDGWRGWIPATEAKVSKGADVVTVRGLDFDERVAVGDAGIGEHGATWYRRNLKRCECGIVEVNGKKKARDIRRWLEELDDPGHWTLLGLYIAALTEGDDPDEIQRNAVLVDDEEEVADEESATKSTE